jgi:hypothetical protein
MKDRGLCLNVHKWTTPTTTNVISCIMALKLLKYSSGMARFITADRWRVPLLSLREGHQVKCRVREGPKGVMLFEGRSRGSDVVCGIGIEGGRIELSFIEHSLVIEHLVNKHIQACNQTSIP